MKLFIDISQKNNTSRITSECKQYTYYDCQPYCLKLKREMNNQLVLQIFCYFLNFDNNLPLRVCKF